MSSLSAVCTLAGIWLGGRPRPASGVLAITVTCGSSCAVAGLTGAATVASAAATAGGSPLAAMQSKPHGHRSAIVLQPAFPSARHDDTVRRLHFFHDEVGVSLLHAAQRGDAIAEEAPITLHVGDAHLQQIVEATRHHVALHHLIVR